MATSPTLIEPRMVASPPFTVDVPDSPSIPGETIPRRNALSPYSLRSKPSSEIETVFDIVKYSAAKYGDKKALGSRRLIKKHHEVKKVKKVVDGQLKDVDKNWTFFECGEYEYMSYTEHEKCVLELGSGLRKLGLRSEDGDRVHIFASTSAHWLALAHGAMSQSLSIVTAYDTLGEEGLRHSLVATKAKAIFLEPHLLKTFISTLSSAKYIQTIIYNTDSEHEIRREDLEMLHISHDHLTVLSLDDLRKLGEENMVAPVEPKREDLACIMYTSGSTGTPKGVLLTHGNIIAAVAGVQTQLGPSLHLSDTILAYLPLAHIFEFVVEQIALYFGVTMGYGSPRTLSDGSMRNCKGDIRELKPTILVGIPAVWEMVRKGIVAQVERGSRVARTAFWGALYAKSFLMHNHLPGSRILDSLVFNKVKNATGGRLRVCITAAAPIARETQEFISMTIAPVINAYGSTETCGETGWEQLPDPRHSPLPQPGPPESCVEIKLVDFPDAGYYSTNARPQGEIWIRGPSVMLGYYQNPVERDGNIPESDWKGEGGWFMTGDIGEWDENGQLRVIDRKKNLVKTLNGEYIALEKLESIYRSVAVVSNICVYASVTETYPIAIIVPAEPALKKLADTLGVAGNGIGDLPHSPIIQAEVLKQLQAAGRRAGFASMEILVGVVLADEEWTPVNGLVTATNKLNRRGLYEKYKKEILGAYGKKS